MVIYVSSRQTSKFLCQDRHIVGSPLLQPRLPLLTLLLPLISQLPPQNLPTRILWNTIQPLHPTFQILKPHHLSLYKFLDLRLSQFLRFRRRLPYHPRHRHLISIFCRDANDSNIGNGWMFE